MVFAETRGIYTSQMDDLDAYQPDDSGDFCVVVRAMIGPNGAEGEESFDISVCTPRWLSRQVEKDGLVWGRHHLIVANYDPVHIKKIISRFVERCSGESWQEVGEKLSRIGYWEFEDYRREKPHA